MTTPEEVYTLAYCHACDMVSLAGDLERQEHPAESEGDQLGCPRCHSRLNAGSFYDYVDIDVTGYGQ